MINWLIYWLIGWLIDLLVGWLIDRFIPSFEWLKLNLYKDNQPISPRLPNQLYFTFSQLPQWRGFCRSCFGPGAKLRGNALDDHLGPLGAWSFGASSEEHPRRPPSHRKTANDSTVGSAAARPPCCRSVADDRLGPSRQAAEAKKTKSRECERYFGDFFKIHLTLVITFFKGMSNFVLYIENTI